MLGSQALSETENLPLTHSKKAFDDHIVPSGNYSLDLRFL